MICSSSLICSNPKHVGNMPANWEKRYLAGETEILLDLSGYLKVMNRVYAIAVVEGSPRGADATLQYMSKVARSG